MIGGSKTASWHSREPAVKQFLIIVIIIGLMAACVPSMRPLSNKPAAASQTAATPASYFWWEQAVFYEIFVRSFFDSNGDGIGDFNGITEKLDYLKNLGISAIWLMPIHPSSSYHGYDVVDYFSVNPDYGTLDDFKRLLAEAHKRGMHVIIDLVLNHTSNQNPWFVEANNNPQSPYRNWYIWSATDPGYLGPLGIAWHAGKSGYYYGIFGPGMPDLNYNNPDVTAEMRKVVQFWLNEVGVDGFRIDAANYLIEEGQKQVNTLSTHNWFKGFYTTYKADNPDAFTVGEVFGSDASLASTYTGNQMDMIFNFEIAGGMVNSANGGTSSAIDSALTFSKQAMPDWRFATFLTNHDQNRVMSQLNGNVDKAKTAAFLLLTSPGTPFIYYGEEIGMEGEKPDEQIRRPMQWASDGNAGFSTSTPWEPIGPDYQTYNVTNELNDGNSILTYYRTLIQLRNENDALLNGDLDLITTGNPGVFADLRLSKAEAVLVLANLTSTSISSYSLSLDQSAQPKGVYHLLSLIDKSSYPDLTVTASGGFSNYKPIQEIPAYQTILLLLKSTPPQ